MLRLGIIGTGLMAGIIATACREMNIQVHSVLSRTLPRVRTFCIKHHIPEQKGFTDWHEFFNDDELDAVYIATPTSLKAELLRLCLTFKKHVLVEKPLPDPSFLDPFCEEARRQGLVWMDATHFVHNEFFAQLPALISQYVGHITRIDANFFWPSADNGHIKFNPELEEYGVLGDLGWYPLRLLCSLLSGKDILHLSGFLLKNERQAITEFNVAGYASSNVTFSLSSSYRGTVARQHCTISGALGELTADDFVMPYCGSFVYGKQTPSMSVRCSRGLIPLMDHDTVSVTFADFQHKAMLQHFCDYITGITPDVLSQHQSVSLETTFLMKRIKDELPQIKSAFPSASEK